jgi:hypothetical protein
VSRLGLRGTASAKLVHHSLHFLHKPLASDNRPAPTFLGSRAEQRYAEYQPDGKHPDKSSQHRSRHAQIRPLSEHEKARVKRLAQDLEVVWHAATTTNQDRKQLLRAAIDEVRLRTEAKHYAVKIVWKGGAVTECEVRPRKRDDPPVTATPKDTVELVRTLATEFDDVQIARILAKQGRLTGEGKPFTAHKVATLRNRHGIAVHPISGGLWTLWGQAARDMAAGYFQAFRRPGSTSPQPSSLFLRP